MVVTDGAAAVRALAAGHEIRAEVPRANIVDTVGAGDAFGGAFLAWWIGNGFGRDALRDPDAVAPGDPCRQLRLGGDLYAPRRGTAVGL